MSKQWDKNKRKQADVVNAQIRAFNRKFQENFPLIQVGKDVISASVSSGMQKRFKPQVFKNKYKYPMKEIRNYFKSQGFKVVEHKPYHMQLFIPGKQNFIDWYHTTGSTVSNRIITKGKAIPTSEGKIFDPEKVALLLRNIVSDRGGFVVEEIAYEDIGFSDANKEFATHKFAIYNDDVLVESFETEKEADTKLSEFIIADPNQAWSVGRVDK